MQESSLQNDREIEQLGASDQSPEPPFITKVTMLYGDRNEVYERALQSHIDHGKKHGYPVKVLRQKMLGRLWTKPAWLLSIVLDELAKPPEQRTQWIFWFDADTFIANPDIPLEIFLPPKPAFSHIHFLCGNDHNGLNDGAFLLKVNDFALHMLAASLSVETYRPEIDLKYSEQSAIEHVVLSGDVYRPWDGTRYIDGYARIPQRWMNAYMGARDEDGQLDSKKKQHSNSILEGGESFNAAFHVLESTIIQLLTFCPRSTSTLRRIWRNQKATHEHFHECLGKGQQCVAKASRRLGHRAGS